jgi:molybdopterin molybdotransferase
VTAPRLPVEEAIARILDVVTPLSAEAVSVRAALHRVLSENIHAPYSHPAWRNSAMDGYAVRAADLRGATQQAPILLPVRGTVAAGDSAPTSTEPRTAWRIMTGAPVPDDCDTVVRVEDTNAGISDVSIVNDRDANRNVRPRAEDFAAGDTLLRAGTVLMPAHIGLAAACGRVTVDVVRKPRVAIISSGNELVDVDQFAEVRAGKRIINTNSYAIAAAVLDAGGEPIDLGIAPDNPESIAERIMAAPKFDALVTSGGISVGAFDYTRDVVQRLGATLDFWRVRMRPGGPFGFGVLGDAAWFGLPGNPVSSMVTFELFVRPALLRMSGRERVLRAPVDVILAEPVTTQGGLTHFLRAVVDDQRVIHLTGPQGSGLLTSVAAANALLIVPHDTPYLAAGAAARAVLLHDNSQMAVKWTF